MILLLALPVGLLTGLLLARVTRRRWELPPLRVLWLVVISFIPQYFAIYLPATRQRLPDFWAAVCLLGSQGLFLIFCWLNRRVPGVPLIAAGLILNLLVMSANGGFMPISPQTALHLTGGGSLSGWPLGGRFGWKDVLLLPGKTQLAFLSDLFVLPGRLPYQVAFSPGDVFVAAGAFWLLAAGAFARRDSHQG